MRLGCCVSPELVEAAAHAGYDFVELSAAALLPEEPEERFLPVRERLAGAPVTAEVWELSPPTEVKICGPRVDWPRAARYVNTAIRRAAAVGGSVVAFACGECCDAPADFSRESALGQVTDFLRVIGAVARRYGVIVGIEPLDAECSVLVNSLPDAADLAREVNMPDVGVLPNCSHMAAQGHSPFDVVDAAGWLAHAHVSMADLAPARGGHDPAGEFVEALGMADYDGRIGVQADWMDSGEQMKHALELLRRCCERSQEA